jgi:hypothetical protein
MLGSAVKYIMRFDEGGAVSLPHSHSTSATTINIVDFEDADMGSE